MKSLLKVQIVSLTTDFGTQDYYVGELKGVLLDKIDHLSIIDISHDIEPFDIVQASFYLNNTYRNFPKDSIHILAVQTYYSKRNELLAFQKDDHYFIGPNNGVFSLIWDDLKEEDVYVINTEDMEVNTLSQSLTHAAALISHGLSLNEIGPRVQRLERKMLIQPVITRNQIRATIIHIDRFDNAIVNLRKDQFESLRAGRPFQLYFKHDDPIYHFNKHYAEVPVGEALALWNSAGFLEIAVNMGRASSLYNLNKNETIQIYFLD